MGKIASETYPLAPSATDVMQEEIRHTEAEITDTLHSIEAKLAPSRLKAQVKEKVVNGSVNAVVHTAYAIKRRPLPSFAIGATLLWLMRRRARRRKAGEAAALSTVAVEALPKELRRNPVQTFRKYLTVGRMVFAFLSVASAALLRGQRARQALNREPERYHDFEHPPRM